MNWSPPLKPDGESRFYDYVSCSTPIGIMRIEWKSWKDDPDYTLSLDDEYISDSFTLEGAKDKALEYIIELRDSIVKYLRDE